MNKELFLNYKGKGLKHSQFCSGSGARTTPKIVDLGSWGSNIYY